MKYLSSTNLQYIPELSALYKKEKKKKKKEKRKKKSKKKG